MKEYAKLGVRNGQLVHRSGDGDIPLVNIIGADGTIIGGFHSEDIARYVVKLLNDAAQWEG